MEIRLNGERRQVQDGATLGTLLEELKTQPEMVTVELNGRILERGEIAATVLGQGDQVKVLHFMGGGR